jgi:hypothetical protein
MDGSRCSTISLATSARSCAKNGGNERNASLILTSVQPVDGLALAP